MEPQGLSPGEEQLWFLDQLDPHEPAYNVPMLFDLRGPLDRRLLSAAVTTVFSTFEAFTMTYPTKDGIPQRVCRPDLPLAMPLAFRRDPQPAKFVRAEIRRPFSLQTGPLARGYLISVDVDHHLLLLVFHHIIVDSDSLRVVIRSLSDTYAALRNSDAPPPGPTSVRYAEFGAWQRGQAVAPGARDFWLAELVDAPARTAFPSVSSNGQSPFSGGAVRRSAGRSLRVRLRQQSASWKVTPFAILLANLYLLLYRYSGQSDLVVGVAMSTRRESAHDNVDGFCVNSVPVRVKVDRDQSFASAVRIVQEQLLRVHQHAVVPLEHIVEFVNPPRTEATPLYQVLALIDDPVGLELAGVVTRPLFVHTGTAKFQTTFAFSWSGERLEWTLEYSRKHFDAEWAAAVGRHFSIQLRHALDEPNIPVRYISALSAREIQARSSPGRVSRPALRPAYQIISARADRQPEEIAIIDGGDVVSYRTLTAGAELVAARLLGQNVSVGEPVGVCMHRSARMVTAMLGVLAAGGAYLPLDPDLPPGRMASMLADAGARFVVVSRHTASVLPPEAGGRISFEDAVRRRDGLPVKLPRVTESSWCYVVFTSGSTGRPKGIAMSHGAVSNLIGWQCDRPYSPLGTVLLGSALGFDVSIQEILCTLAEGGTLVAPSEAIRRDPDALWAFLIEKRIDTVFLPFIALDELARHAGEYSRLAVPRTFITAGEQLRVGALRSMFDHRRLVNQYGPSETHVCTEYILPPDARSWELLPAIGQPIANARVYVLDQDLQHVPPRVTGEIFVGGASLSSGYVGTARREGEERFVPDPFAPHAGDRMYRTGDLGAWNGGHLEFHGRVDGQVKIRGYRVEPAEVEAVLGSHPSVEECSVVSYDHDVGDKRLAVFWAPVPRTDEHDPDFRAFLRDSLPDYLIPTSFTKLSALPRTSNGKVALGYLARRAHDHATGDTAQDVEASQPSDLRAIVRRCWRELLGAADIDDESDFFELGGHSLLATRLAARLREATAGRAAVRTVFDHPRFGAYLAALQIPPAGDRDVPAEHGRQPGENPPVRS